MVEVTRASFNAIIGLLGPIAAHQIIERAFFEEGVEKIKSLNKSVNILLGKEAEKKEIEDLVSDLEHVLTTLTNLPVSEIAADHTGKPVNGKVLSDEEILIDENYFDHLRSAHRMVIQYVLMIRNELSVKIQ